MFIIFHICKKRNVTRQLPFNISSDWLFGCYLVHCSLITLLWVFDWFLLPQISKTLTIFFDIKVWIIRHWYSAYYIKKSHITNILNSQKINNGWPECPVTNGKIKTSNLSNLLFSGSRVYVVWFICVSLYFFIEIKLLGFPVWIDQIQVMSCKCKCRQLCSFMMQITRWMVHLYPCTIKVYQASSWLLSCRRN